LTLLNPKVGLWHHPIAAAICALAHSAPTRLSTRKANKGDNLTVDRAGRLEIGVAIGEFATTHTRSKSGLIAVGEAAAFRGIAPKCKLWYLHVSIMQYHRKPISKRVKRTLHNF
jgi:hypothetical protein